jgi:hypothetical protein
LDFTPRSLWEAERFFAANTEGPGVPTKSGFLTRDLGSWLFSFGAYIGEVVREALQGEWMTNDADPAGEINVALQLPGGVVTWPLQRVIKRFRDGYEDGDLVGYGIALGLDVGPRPDAS